MAVFACVRRSILALRMHPLLCRLAFVGFSTWCTLYNKYILEKVLPSSNLLLLLQGCVTIASLHAMQLLGLIHCPSISFRWPRPKTSSNDRADLTVGLLYALNVMFGLWSLKLLIIPIFGTLKRAAVVVVWLGEYFILNTRGATQCLPPLLIMVAGATLAGRSSFYSTGIPFCLALFVGARFVIIGAYANVLENVLQTQGSAVGGAFWHSTFLGEADTAHSANTRTLIAPNSKHNTITTEYSPAQLSFPIYVAFSVLTTNSPDPGKALPTSYQQQAT